MKIVIAGGSGFIGRALSEHFTNRGDEVIVFSRGSSKVENNVSYVQWDGTTLGNWTNELKGTDVILNLTGKSVDCRYTDANKAEIVRSRVDSTAILGEAIAQLESPPRVWLNASTATIYRHSENEPMDEYTGEIGDDFSMNVAKAWEEAFAMADTPQTRKVTLRISLVIGKSGGVYPVLRRLARFGVGGRMGSGNQRFAWIHIEDVIRIVNYAIENESIEGAINCTGPYPPTNREFLQELRKTLRVPFGLPQPVWLLKMGAAIIGTESELILKSRYAVPQKLLDHGFEFKFKTHQKALADLAK